MQAPVPPVPSRFATLMVATANVLNLAQPGRHFYDGQNPYSQHEFDRKVAWLGERFKALNADVLAVQEVWDELALRAAVAAWNAAPVVGRLVPRIGPLLGVMPDANAWRAFSATTASVSPWY